MTPQSPGAEPNLGTAVEAIEFALALDDAWTDRCQFLESWLHGDISEWPEFKPAPQPEKVLPPVPYALAEFNSVVGGEMQFSDMSQDAIDYISGLLHAAKKEG